MSVRSTWAIFGFYNEAAPGATRPLTPSAGRSLAIFAMIFPVVDSFSISICVHKGVLRSNKGIWIAAISLSLCSMVLICSTFLFNVLREASSSSADKAGLFKSYCAVVCLHGLQAVLMWTIFMRHYVVPNSKRFPKNYKPFTPLPPESQDASSSRTSQSEENGRLATIFEKQ